MCGIAGWADWERDLTHEKGTVEAMTRTMACRGPDAAGSWLSSRAGIGHRRLAVIDLEGGAQPMTARVGEQTVVLTYSGEVYNFRELRDQLSARGHVFRTGSDTEVVLNAYLEWGPDLARHLNGMFAFAVWDERSQELVLVRDRLGVKPLYYAVRGSAVLFGSEPKAILANPLVDPRIDLDGLADLFVMAAKRPGDAVYRDLREVAPGTVVRCGRDGARVRTYWQLEARPHEDDLDTTVATVRDLLTDIVDRQLVTDVPLCSLLSGGLDSSVVTALAARHLTAQGRGTVSTFSVDFVHHEQGFAADALHSSPDAPFAKAAARYIGSSHQEIVLDAGELYGCQDEAIAARDLPGIGDLDASLLMLFREVRKHSTVALSGEAADEVFGGYPWYAAEAARPTASFPWAAGAGDRNAVLSSDLRGKLDLNAYAADRYAEAVRQAPTLPGEEGVQRRMREVFHLNLTRFLPFLLDRKDRMSMAVGLEVRVPFCDHRLVEYAWNIPWSLHTADGVQKSVLRRAARGLVHADIVDRPKSAFPSGVGAAYLAATRERARALLADRSSPVLALVDTDAVAGMVRATESGPGSFSPPPMLPRILQLDAWLRRYRVDVVV
ncbi:asparagine synthase (glutamine-hydrolyzing) [Streptomyces anandii]|uniref:asparagine synthase (glutamine-hydrolyzing) n=1 Tax=Streptomyces anandii TaxID=285454 RepID=UPI001678854B|nr:asparagine synthase (glutamine-hydrolyzing) [Streptomyces anandii]GGX81592.1 asparagine synthetase B [Streptomyces anandii JCM 4720]